MRMSLNEQLKKWDSDAFDLTEALEHAPARKSPEDTDERSWKDRPVARLERDEVAVFRKIYPYAAVFLCIVLFASLLTVVIHLPAFGDAEAPTNNEVIRRYVEQGLEETGAVNIVAGVILDYRAFDTLGESHVLFTAATAVFILLLSASSSESKTDPQPLRQDNTLRVTAKILVPLIIMFGIYVILNGHLGPGGGFSGGAVIGGGLILYAAAFGFDQLEKLINLRRYRIIVLCSLLFYSCSKCYSFFCGANGYETIFTAGTPGKIFSAGLILPLNIAVGIVVACTMYGFYAVFKRGRI